MLMENGGREEIREQDTSDVKGGMNDLEMVMYMTKIQDMYENDVCIQDDDGDEILDDYESNEIATQYKRIIHSYTMSLFFGPPPSGSGPSEDPPKDMCVVKDNEIWIGKGRVGNSLITFESVRYFKQEDGHWDEPKYKSKHLVRINSVAYASGTTEYTECEAKVKEIDAKMKIEAPDRELKNSNKNIEELRNSKETIEDQLRNSKETIHSLQKQLTDSAKTIRSLKEDLNNAPSHEAMRNATKIITELKYDVQKCHNELNAEKKKNTPSLLTNFTVRRWGT